MRDLYKILQICAAEDAMDYCQEFEEIQSILEYCNKHVTPFKKLVFRSGNEIIINELARRIEELLVNRQLVDAEKKTPLPEAHQKLRKILMFLLLNTDATYKYNLREDSNYVHVIEICPLLPKFLTVALIWELQLDKFFYEALAYTPCWFAFQYFEAANESLKYIEDARKALDMIEQLLRALLMNVERTTLIQMDAVDQKIIFNKLKDQTFMFLRRFNTPDVDVFEKMGRTQLQRYCGFKCKHLLQTILFAFDIYESQCEMSPDFDAGIYQIGTAFHKTSPERSESYHAAKEIEFLIINTILSTLETCAMEVKMKDFVEWAEVDLTPTLTLQQAIGEMAFTVRERISGNGAFEHSVEGILRSIEIRPKPLSEIVREATIGAILRNLDDSSEMSYETKKLWFDELFVRFETTLGNDECRQTIAEHLKLITLENCKKYIDFIELNHACREHLRSIDDDYEDNHEDLIELLLAAVKELAKEDILDLLMYQRQVFGKSFVGMSDDSENFEQRSTELLNKCTTVFDHHEFLLLCFERPFEMWKKFFTLTCNVVEHVPLFADIVRQTLPYSYFYADKMIREAVINPIQLTYFPELLCEIYFIIYCDENRVPFLAKFLNDRVKSCLDAEKYNSLLPIIKALNLITQRGDTVNFDELTAPMLAMVAVVADLSRWNLTTFSNIRVELVELSINFISNTLKKFKPIATEKDRKWLSAKIKSSCMPITQFYFQNISCQKKEDILPLDIFLYSEEIVDKPRALKFLSKFLIRCISTEFKSLACSTRFSPYILQAIHQLAINVKRDPTSNAVLNLRHCLGEYINIVNDVLKPKCDTGKQAYELLHSLLVLISALPDEIYDQIFLDTECLLKDTFKQYKESFNRNELTELSSFVSKMKDCRAKNIFLQTLNHSVSAE